MSSFHIIPCFVVHLFLIVLNCKKPISSQRLFIAVSSNSFQHSGQLSNLESTESSDNRVTLYVCVCVSVCVCVCVSRFTFLLAAQFG